MGLEDLETSTQRFLQKHTKPPVRYELPRDVYHADYTYEVIVNIIKEFEQSLDDEHEVAVKLASFGQSLTLSVTNVGYVNPSTLLFYGYIGEQHATLVQHMSQLNFLLLAVKKLDPSKPTRRIGFAPPIED